jgi:hypothetical protein
MHQPMDQNCDLRRISLLIQLIKFSAPHCIGNLMKSFTITLLLASLLTSLTGCGTLLHPERKGQTGGRIDPGVVILDGVGLLFFFIPGAIAFAVDFTYGTIYLPGGRRASLDDQELEQLTNDGQINIKALTSIVQENAASDMALSHQDVHTMQLSSTEQLPKAFMALPQ